MISDDNKCVVGLHYPIKVYAFYRFQLLWCLKRLLIPANISESTNIEGKGASGQPCLVPDRCMKKYEEPSSELTLNWGKHRYDITDDIFEIGWDFEPTQGFLANNRALFCQKLSPNPTVLRIRLPKVCKCLAREKAWLVERPFLQPY